MTGPILRSMGNALHIVGPLTVSNYFLNPNFFLASGNVTDWTRSNITLKPVNSPTAPEPGISAAQFVATSLTPRVGFYQEVAVSQLSDYTFSAFVSVPSALSTTISYKVVAMDSNSLVLATLGGVATVGGVTNGWVRPSQTFTMPVGTVTAEFWIQLDSPTFLDSFYVAGMQLEPGDTASAYNDGNFSGYVWSGSPGVSPTLKSEFPDALYAFATYPLSGGIGVGAKMYGPNYTRLVD